MAQEIFVLITVFFLMVFFTRFMRRRAQERVRKVAYAQEYADIIDNPKYQVSSAYDK